MKMVEDGTNKLNTWLRTVVAATVLFLDCLISNLELHAILHIALLVLDKQVQVIRNY